jgi:glycosyltransferase involved in cell wall biosynthesis
MQATSSLKLPIGIISPYGKHAGPMASKSDSALNWYTSELAFELSSMARVLVVAPRGYRPRWRDGEVEIVEGYRRGSPWSAFQLAISALRSDVKILNIQHELFAFGGPVSALTLPIALRVLQLFGRRIVTTMHGVIAPSDITPSFVRNNGSHVPPFVARLAWRWLVRGVCSASNLILVHDEAHRRVLAQDYAIRNRVEVVALGIRPSPLPSAPERASARAELGMTARDEVLTFFGYFAGYKGLERLFCALPRLLKERANLHVILAGDVPDRLAVSSPLARHAALLAAADHRVHHLGFVPEAKVRQVLIATDALILPYTAGISASGPLALAAGCGTPVLLSRLLANGSPERFVFDPTPEGIEGAVTSFFDDGEVRDQSMEYVLRLREERSWGTVARRMLALYGQA